MYEFVTWLVYATAALMMLTVIVAAILAGIGLGLVARFLREFGKGRQEGDT